MTDNDNNVTRPGDEPRYPTVHHMNSEAVFAEKVTNHSDGYLARTGNAGIS